MSYTNTRDVLGDQATLDALVAHTLSELREDGADTLAPYACVGNTGLTYVEMPGIASKTPGAYAFQSCTGLSSVSFPNLKMFASCMFYGCSALTSIFAPQAKGMSSTAFFACTALQSVNLPALTNLATSAFAHCRALTSFSFSTTLSSISPYAFCECTALSSVSMSGVRTVGSSAFSGCANLRVVSFPNASYISANAFRDCPIRELALPSVSYLQSYITNMAAKVDISAKPNIPSNVFAGDYDLFSLILRNEQMLTLNNVNALSSTPIAAGLGKIYVPSDLVDTYKSGSNWATYAAQIESLENYTDDRPTGGETITDSWATILSNSNYATDYSVGDTKWLSVDGTYALMQIVAFDRDELSDNTGNAHITWLCKGYEFKHKMNTTSVTDGGWAASEMRTWLINDVLPTIDTTVRAGIKTVKKTYYSYLPVRGTETCDDAIWVPSYREVYGGTGNESSGCVYTDFFTDQTSRIKYAKWSAAAAGLWWVRTAHNQSYFIGVSSSGTYQITNADAVNARVVFGFCT